MSGGHYDCFYEWDDWDEVERRIQLVSQVADDYDAMSMIVPAAVCRSAIARMEAFMRAWKSGCVGDLCRTMDWYKSGDDGVDTLKEKVKDTLNKLME